MKGTATRPDRSAALLYAILIAYSCARILESVRSPVPRIAIVTLDVVSALAFAIVHGARQYRWRGILVFAGIFIVAGNLTENLGVATGFPFGRYYFLDLMGPKLFHVPVLLGAAYIGMAYVSWTLGRLICGSDSGSNAGIFEVPFAASFIMVAWDLAQDPIWSTVLRGWIWQDGGPWFGVPITNYLGWFGNVFVIYVLFAIYLRRRSSRQLQPSRRHWRMAIGFYTLCAAGNVLQLILKPHPAIVEDPTGHPWRVDDIVAASALVSLFLMGAFAAFAWIRLKPMETQPTG